MTKEDKALNNLHNAINFSSIYLTHPQYVNNDTIDLIFPKEDIKETYFICPTAWENIFGTLKFFPKDKIKVYGKKKFGKFISEFVKIGCINAKKFADKYNFKYDRRAFARARRHFYGLEQRF